MKTAYLLLALGLAGLKGCSPALQRYEFERPQMGTVFRIVLYAAEESAANAAAAAAFARIDQLNATLSDYDPQSELSRLSQTSGSGQAVPVGDDLWVMLQASQRIAKQTGGAFDITIGPVVKLWRRARRQGRLPDAQALEQALAAVGHEKIVLNPAGRTAELKEPGMSLDLGGIAKGYAADEALEVLRQRGIRRVLVAAGGDVVVSDPPPGKKGWVVAVKAMLDPDMPAPYLLLRDAAVSTSGDAFQYVVIDGKRYSHIIDPRTGLGLTTPMGVTVVARKATMSDAYATAIAVLGPGRGLELIEAVPGAAAIVQWLNEQGELELQASAGVRRLRFVDPEP